ncbi:MAG: glycosyltransferase [Planctomycetota bacterium]|jgi:glycosyltransferase involved in cell wall biosynthesis
MRIAVLAPTFPVRSETFVHREARALMDCGQTILPFSLHASADVPEEAADLGDRTDYLYPNRSALLQDVVAEGLRHPLRSIATLALGFRDAVAGRFSQKRQRRVVPLQALAALALARRLRRCETHHLHIHFAHSAATVGMYAARQAGIEFSVVAHARDVFVEGSLIREKARRALRFATISEASRRRVCRENRIDPATITVVACGVDCEHFSPDGRRRDPNRIVAVGRLVEKKGFGDLIHAFAAVESRDASLTIVGDGPERSKLEGLVEELGVTERVDLVGSRDGDEIVEILRSAALFVLPARRAADGDLDGIPVVLMEAMAVGVTVLSTRVAGIPELVENDVQGYLVEAGDIDALTARIEQALGDPVRNFAMGGAGRRRVLRERELSVVTERLVRMFRRDSEEALPVSRFVKRASEGQRVVLVTPARDEVGHLPRLAKSVVAQSLRPERWIIVDDGSTDGTLEFARELAREHDWIEVVSRGDRGARKLGGGVIEAFDGGYSRVDFDHDYVAKLDADMSFESTYLERILQDFEADPRLGSASGKVFRPDPSGLVEEFMIDAMVAGQFKLYRRTCFEEIGGFVREVMWDGIDFHRARQHGWRTASLHDPELRLLHHRLMGSSDRSVYRGRMRWGRGQWFMGTHPLYLVASASLRAFEKPYLVGGALIVAGYVKAAIARAPRYTDLDFRLELRQWQLGRLGRLLAGGQVR